MSISIEHETRLMINETQYQIMMSHYSNYANKKLIKNENIYLDDDLLSITNLGHMLRIRIIDDKQIELTLKLKSNKSNKEINQIINRDEKEYMLSNQQLIDGDVKQYLKQLNICLSSIKPIAILLTNRCEIIFDNYLLCIDDNQYNNEQDYNIEIESNISYEHAETMLDNLMQQFHLKHSDHYIVKSKRAIDSYLGKYK